MTQDHGSTLTAKGTQTLQPKKLSPSQSSEPLYSTSNLQTSTSIARLRSRPFDQTPRIANFPKNTAIMGDEPEYVRSPVVCGASHRNFCRRDIVDATRDMEEGRQLELEQ